MANRNVTPAPGAGFPRGDVKSTTKRRAFPGIFRAAERGTLEDVTGGSIHETADDSRCLNVLLRGHPAQPDWYGEQKINSLCYGSADRRSEIKKAWEAVGVTAFFREADHDEYYVNGFSVTHQDARDHAMKVMGRQLRIKDWYWDD